MLKEMYGQKGTIVSDGYRNFTIMIALCKNKLKIPYLLTVRGTSLK